MHKLNRDVVTQSITTMAPLATNRARVPRTRFSEEDRGVHSVRPSSSVLVKNADTKPRTQWKDAKQARDEGQKRTEREHRYLSPPTATATCPSHPRPAPLPECPEFYGLSQTDEGRLARHFSAHSGTVFADALSQRRQFGRQARWQFGSRVGGGRETVSCCLDFELEKTFPKSVVCETGACWL